VFNGIPFRSPGGIVSDSDREMKSVDELTLEFGFPGVAATTIAAAGIRQNEELAAAGIALEGLPLPPPSDGMSGEGGGVMGDADHHRAAVGERFIKAVGNGDPDRVRAEIVIVDQPGGAIPGGTGVPEVAHQFALFGVYTDDGQSAATEVITQIGDVVELEVAVGAGIGGQLLAIDAQGVIHLVQEPSDGIGRDSEAVLGEDGGDLDGGAPRPFQAGDGIAGRVVLEQVVDS
jgi:hypothetical protein